MAETTSTPGGAPQSHSMSATGAEVLTLPQGLSLSEAEFKIDGDDLVLTFPDGSKVTVEDYYSQPNPPQLASGDGANLSGDMVVQLTGTPEPTNADAIQQFAQQTTGQVIGGTDGAPIGTVKTLTGEVWVTRADGTRIQLKQGDQVFQGDNIETGPNGAIGVLLADETTFSMGSESQMVLDEMIYDPSTQNGSLNVSVVQGVFTFVSGQVAKTDPDAMKIDTPVATIGIRGTQVGIEIPPEGEMQVILMQEADGFVGEVVIENNTGQVVMNQGGDYIKIGSYDTQYSDRGQMRDEEIVERHAITLRHLPVEDTSGERTSGNHFGLQEEIETGAGQKNDQTQNEQQPSAEQLANMETAAGGQDKNSGTGQPQQGPAQPTAEQLNNLQTDAGGQGFGEDFTQVTTSIDPYAGNTQNTGLGTINVGAPPPTQQQTTGTPVDNTAQEAERAAIQQAIKDAESAVTRAQTSYDNARAAANEAQTFAQQEPAAQTAANTATAAADSAQAALDAAKAALEAAKKATTAAEAQAAANTANNAANTAQQQETAANTANDQAEAIVVEAGQAQGAEVADVSASGDEDTSISLNLNITKLDSDETAEITLSGIPAGAILANADGPITVNPDGTVTLTEAQLAGLTITPPANSDADFNIGVSVITIDGQNVSTPATATITVGVAGVADVPTLEVGSPNVSGIEDGGAIALDISAALTDTDGSETLSITISGVPAGAVLSAGTQNADGTWTLSAADLEGLTITPAANSGADFQLTVTATSTEADGGSATTSTTIDVSVAAQADAPTVTASSLGGLEDGGPIALNIDAAAAAQDMQGEVVSVTISGVPEGAVLTAGVKNDDGTWTLSPADLDGLAITLPADFDENFSLSVTATAEETDPDTGAVTQATSAPVSFTVEVGAVADAPTVTTAAVTGDEDSAIALTINAAAASQDINGEIVSFTISGVPAGAALSAGTDNGDGTWTLSPADLDGLTITPPLNSDGDFTLQVTATAQETDPETGAVTTATSEPVGLNVTVNAVADGATVNTGIASGDEDTAIGLPISITKGDDSETAEITLSGIPAGAVLANANGPIAVNEDGSVTLSEADLEGLTITPPANSDVDIPLTISVVTIDGDSRSAPTTGTINVGVNGVADVPTLEVGSAVEGTGIRGDGIPLNISSALTDTDGSETLSVTISGVPAGAVLSAGTKNEDGTWTLSPADLEGLTVTPADDSGEDFQLTITATATEADGSTATSTATIDVDVNRVVGSAAGDTIDLAEEGDSVAYAGEGDDTITGTDGDDVIFGEAGNDVLIGGAGNDVLDGGEGSDTVDFSALDPNSPLYVDLGAGTASSADGEDTLVSSENVIGGAGDDVIIGSDGNNTLVGGLGDDVITGGAGDDVIVGGEGVDTAVFEGDFEEFTIDLDSATGELSVAGGIADGTDSLTGIEILRFGDMEISVSDLLTAAVPDVGPSQGVNVTEDFSVALPLSATLDETVQAGTESLSVTLSGIPEGAVLTAGGQPLEVTYDENGVGSITFPGGVVPADLAITPPANSAADFTLTLTATSTASATTNGVADTASSVQTITVNVAPDAEAPTITLTGNNTFAEDALVPLGDVFGAVPAEAGEEVVSFTIGGLPEGATLSAGVQNEDGTWTVDAADMAGLTMTLPKDLDADFSLTVSATSAQVDPDNPSQIDYATSDPVQVPIVITAQADAPTLSVSDVTGTEDQAIPLNIEAALTDSSEVLSVTISGVPDGAILSAGTKNDDGTWTLSAADLNGLTVTPSLNSDQDFALTVSVTSTETDPDTGAVTTATTTGTFAVSVAPDADAPTLVLDNALGSEDTAIPLNISAGLTDDSETLSITISGLPQGAVLSAGTQNEDGSWTLSPADLEGLTVTPPANSNEDLSLTVTATSTESDGSTASTTSTLNVAVTGVADAPTLSIDLGEGVLTGGIIEPTGSVVIQNMGGITAGYNNTYGYYVMGDDGTPQMGEIIWPNVKDSVGQVFTLDGVDPEKIGFFVIPDGASRNPGMTPGMDVTFQQDSSGNWHAVGPNGQVLSGAGDPVLFSDPALNENNFNYTQDAFGPGNQNWEDLFGGGDNNFNDVNVNVVTTPSLPVGGDSFVEYPLNINAALTDTDGSETLSATISGLPAGSTVTMADGTSFTVTDQNTQVPVNADQLQGITVKVPAGLDFDLQVTATSTENDGDTASVSTTVGVDVPDAVADDPTLEVSAAQGDEDTAIALDISAALTDLDGSETLSITISGVPAGAVLNHGTQNPDGTWTLTADDLNGLTITPAANDSSNFDLTITATSTEVGGDTASVSQTLSVTVAGVADAPTLEVSNASGAEDTAIPLNISAGLTDDSEILSVSISGIPNGAVLMSGDQVIQVTNGVANLTPDQLSGLTITPSANSDADFNLTVTATSTETDPDTGANGTATTTGTIAVSVAPDADAPVLVINDAVGNEDTGIPLDISATLSDPSEQLSVSISGIPAGATLTITNPAGKLVNLPIHDGVANVPAGLLAQGGDLIITPPKDSADDFQLTVTATSTDGSSVATTSGTLNVTVNGVADGAVVTSTSSQGIEDVAIPITVNVAEIDIDGSEALTVTLSNIPEGAVIFRNGEVVTPNEDGTVTLAEGELDGLSVLPPANFSGTFQITVSAQTNDEGDLSDIATGSITVDVAGVADGATVSDTTTSGAEDTAIALPITIDKADASETAEITLSGIPQGAVLANANGPIPVVDGIAVLTEADLDGLTITPPANSDADFNLGVSVVTTDGTSVSEPTTGTIGVSVDGIADVPTLEVVSAASGVEDGGPIALDIASALTDTDGSETLSITISGVPAGAVLSAGTLNEDGSWTLSAGDLQGLTVTPAANSGADFQLTVTATSTEADGGTATNTATIDVSVASQADAPTVTASSQGGLEDGGPIPLNIDATAAAQDVQGEVISLTISGVPEGAVLNNGVNNGDGTWSVTPEELDGLAITLPEDFDENFSLTVTATAEETDPDTGETTYATSAPVTFEVEVGAVADAPTVTTQAASGAEDSAIPLVIDAAAASEDLAGEVVSLTISGVPAGAVLSAGTQNEDGSWTLSPADLDGLTITPPANSGADFTLQVTATAQETDPETGEVTTATSAPVDLAVSVAAVADTPSLNVGPVTGAEDTAIPLNITAGLNDQDGSEVLSVTITGVPAGAVLSAGTYDAASNTWTLSGDQLDGLTVTPPENSDADFQLGVIVTATDTDPDTGAVTTATTRGTIEVTVDGVADGATLTLDAARGDEDTAIALPISIDKADADETAEITLSGIPQGAVLSNANGPIPVVDGVAVLTEADLDGLQILPPANSGADFQIGVSVITIDGTSVSAPTTGTINVGVDAVADVPTLSVASASGAEDTAIPLNISAGLNDQDGSEVLSVTISDVPPGAVLTLADGSTFTATEENSTFLFAGDQLSGLTVTPPPNSDADFVLTVTATTIETDPDTGVETVASVDGTLAVSVDPAADAPTLVLDNAAGDEDQWIPLSIDAGLTDDSELLSITISGVPQGAVLSAGTQNTDGSWSLSPADLEGLAVKAAPNSNVDFSLTVTATSTESDGSTASTTSTLDVDVKGVADAPTLSLDLGQGTVNEGAAGIPGSVTVQNMGQAEAGYNNTYGYYVMGDDGTPQMGEIIWPNVKSSVGQSFTLDGVDPEKIGFFVIPNGASLNGGLQPGMDVTFQQDGTGNWHVVGPNGQRLNGAGDPALFSDPALNEGGFDYTQDVAAPGNQNWEDLVGGGDFDFNDINMNVTSVPSQPGGDGYVEYPLNINAALTDTDGSETLSATLSGLPAGATVTMADGTTFTVTDANTQIPVTAGQLQGITLTVPVGSEDFNLQVTATATENDGDTASVSASVEVDVLDPVADAPTLQVSNASGDEDTAIPLDISAALTDLDGSETLSITISGVPAGATLSAGTYDAASNTWTLTPDQLSGLTITPPADSSDDFQLTVTATSTESVGGDTATTTATIDVAVAGVADGPTLSATNAQGLEDTVIPLNIQAGLKDLDGSETITSVTISGVPTGAVLNHGTYDAASNTWTLSPADLDGLTVKPATNSSDDFQLTISATTVDEGGSTATATTTMNVAVTGVADAPTLSVNLGEGTLIETPGTGGYVGNGSNLNNTYVDSTSNNHAAGGGDDVWVVNRDLRMNEKFEMGGGNDKLVINGNVPGGVNLNLGGGNDSLTINGNILGNVSINGAGQSNGGGDVLYLGKGSDHYQFQNYTNNNGMINTQLIDLDTGKMMTINNIEAIAFGDGTFRGNGNLVQFETPTPGQSVVEYPLDITSSLTDTDGSETLSITVSGLPQGAVLSAGTANSDGSWTLAPNQLSGLTLTVPSTADSFSLSVTATSTENDGDTFSVTKNVGVSVDDFAETPELAAADAQGNEDTAIALDIDAALTDLDGSETLAVSISGIPAGAVLKSGDTVIQVTNGVANLTPAQLEGLTITPPANSGADFQLTVSATSTESSTGDTNTVSTTMDVTVNAVADTPGLTVSNAAGTEDTAIPLNIGANLNDGDGSEVLSVSITGIPAGAVLANQNGPINVVNGAVTLSAAQLEGLTIQPPANSDVDFNLNVTATATETDPDTGAVTTATTTGSIAVSVDPAADAPTLVVGNAAGSEDAFIPLSIDANLTDGGEQLSITITGLPQGAVLSAGSYDSASDTWTLSAGDLNSLSVKPAPNSNEDMQLTVTATSTESDGSTASTSSTLNVAVTGVADAPTLAVNLGEGTLTGGTETVMGSITFQNMGQADAGYNNTYGYYVMGDDGTPQSGEIIWPNVKTSVGQSFTLDGVDPEKIGFFLIPNGASNNSGMQPGMDVTFQQDNTGNWHVVGPNGQRLSGTGDPVLFDDRTLNENNFDYTRDNSRPGNQNWEDLAGGGDNDFNDVNINVTSTPVQPGTGPSMVEYPLDITSQLTDTDGSETLSATLGGLPVGAVVTLANGTEIAVQSPTQGVAIPADQLQGISLKVPADAANFNLSVTATATENDGDTASVSTSVAVVVDGVADAPELAVSDAAGNEDTDIPLDIAAALTDLDGSETLSITISGVPVGATLSAGTYDAASNTWTLSADDLDGLTVRPAPNSSDDFQLTVSATSTEASTGDTETVTANIDVSVAGVADAPTLTAADAAGDVGEPIPLDIAAGLQDLDGSETLSVTISGIPEGATLSAGTVNPDGSVTLTGAQLEGLSISLPQGGTTLGAPQTLYSQNFSNMSDGTISAGGANGFTSTGGSQGNDNRTAVDEGRFEFQNPTSGNISTWSSAAIDISGKDDVTFKFDLKSSGDMESSGSAGDYFKVIAIVDGVPHELMVKNGGLSGTNTFTLDNIPQGDSLVIKMEVKTTASDEVYKMDNLQVEAKPIIGHEPVENFQLHVEATATEADGDTATVSTDLNVTVNVDNEASAPTLTVSNASGLEDTAIPLDITASLTDLDGSEEITAITISGVPAGAVLNNGTYNAANNTWTLEPADLVDLTVTPAANSSADFQITVSVTSTEANGGATATTSATIDVDVAGVADGVNLSMQNAQGLEDTAIPLNIGASLKDLDGSETITSVTISGVPAGAILNHGTLNSDGTWSLSAADLNGLTVKPAPNSSDDFQLTVSATTTDEGGSTAVSTGSLSVSVTGVADDPTLSVSDATGEAGTTLPLDITAGLQDLDGSETLSVTISGIPQGATLSAGTVNPDGSVTLTGDQLTGLTITLPETQAGQGGGQPQSLYSQNFNDTFDGQTAAWGSNGFTSTGGSWGDDDRTAADNDRFEFQNPSGGDISTFSTAAINISGQENVTFSFDMKGYGDLDSGGSYGDYVKVIAIVDGVEHTLMTHNGDIDDWTTFTLDNIPEGDELVIKLEVKTTADDEKYKMDNLSVTGTPAAAEPLESFQLHVEATATEADGDTATVSADLNVTVNSDNEASAPTLTVSNASGTEDTAVALNIAAALTDTDGSESLAVSISGIPAGAVLKSGDQVIQVTDGVAELSPNQLSGLSITPPANSDADFQLTVTATSTEQNGGATTTTTAAINVAVAADADTPVITSASVGAPVVVDGSGGDEVTINSANVTSGDNGFTVVARTLNSNGSLSNASPSNISFNSNPVGFGVSGGNASGDSKELGFNSAHGKSEELIVAFDDDVSSADVSFAWMHSGEHAKYELYKDGVKVGEGIVTGVTDGVDAPVTLTAANGGSFDAIVFTAPGHDDDFLINSITYETAGSDPIAEYPINVSASLADLDGSESLSVTIGGIPEGATLNHGVNNGDGTWTVAGGDLGGLKLSVPLDGDLPAFNLTFAATATEANGGDTATSSMVTVQAAGVDLPEPAGEVLVDATIGEAEPIVDGGQLLGVAYDLNISASADGNANASDLTITVSGIPAGATLTAGTDNGNGSFTLTPAQLSGLQVVASSAVTGDFALSVVAHSGGVDSIVDKVTAELDPSLFLEYGEENWDNDAAVAGDTSADTWTGDYRSEVNYGSTKNDDLNTGGGGDTLYGGAGNDKLTGQWGADTFYGGSGNDTLAGGDQDDRLYGGSGNDKLDGGTGNDLLYGGSGNDSIFGDHNEDIIFGGSGNDSINAGTGNDTVYGGSGNDTIVGDHGDDRIYGGTGNDKIDAGTGNDYVHGGAGDDSIFGDHGNDTLYGGSGDDTIDGGTGNDILFGGLGDDFLQGGDGNDVLFGGAGNDILRGGSGNDTFIFDADSGHDIIEDIMNQDTLEFHGQQFDMNDMIFREDKHGDVQISFRGHEDMSVTLKGTKFSDLDRNGDGDASEGYSVTQTDDGFKVQIDEH